LSAYLRIKLDDLLIEKKKCAICQIAGEQAGGL
jgi:hypothetical protein